MDGLSEKESPVQKQIISFLSFLLFRSHQICNSRNEPIISCVPPVHVGKRPRIQLTNSYNSLFPVDLLTTPHLFLFLTFSVRAVKAAPPASWNAQS